MIRAQQLITKAAGATTLDGAVLHENARTKLPFQAHYQRFLREKAAQLNAAAAAAAPTTTTADKKDEQKPARLSSLWVPYETAQGHIKNTKGANAEDNKPPSFVQLPLPKYFVNELSRQCLQPRSFCNMDDIERDEVSNLEGLASGVIGKILPRDADNGLFMDREELVDTIQCASHEYKFKSHIWVNQNSDKLTSGWLKLKPGMQPLTICCTALVFDIATIDWVKAEELRTCRSLVQCYKKATSGAAPDVCVNLISGRRTGNEDFNQAFASGGSKYWVTLEQINWLSIPMLPDTTTKTTATTTAAQPPPPPPPLPRDKKKPAARKGGKKSTDTQEATAKDQPEEQSQPSSFENQGTLVEIDQVSLYNQEQLLVPGKVALSVRKEKVALFE